ncbi:STM3941 family protein [Rufibacter aurantiacus]|uniref:STM3941 family protein n=1 Tax=Rufibacter aurantiacus TaxID=2817374 RepID=UPI001B30D8CD|nr:STM3941 family protein [Rufibacter aurantiacus]
MDRIEIYTSKKKSVFMLLGALVFVVLGIWLFLDAEHLTGWPARNPLITQGVGIASVLFFGCCALVAIKRVIKTKLVLTLDPEGLGFYANKSAPLLLEWKDILGFNEVRIQSQKFLVIMVAEPDFWIEKETSFFRRKLMQLNLKNYGSPFNTAAAGLDISHEELTGKLNSYLEEYGSGAHQPV